MSTPVDGRHFDGLSAPVGRTNLDVKRLPVYGVHRHNEDPDGSDLAKALFPHGVTVDHKEIRPGLQRLTAGNVRLDIYTASRTIWFETDALWQFDLSSLAQRAVRTLPKISPLADLKLDALNLLPRSENGVEVRFEPAWRRGTTVAVWHNRKRKDTVVDVSTSHTVKIELPNVGRVPVVGKGGKFGTAHDRNGALCGLNIGWTKLDGKKDDYVVITQAEADEMFRQRFEGAEDLTFRSRLAYRLIESYGAAYLAPCWVYDSNMRVSGRRMTPGAHVLPATTFDEGLSSPRHDDLLGRFMVRDAGNAVSWGAKPGPRSLISWLGQSGGLLPHSRTTASGIVQKLTEAGWICRAFGDGDALQHDWLAKASDGVGKANLAWYVGHADGGSIELVPPDETMLHCSRWSFGDPLRWIVVDACGPLQDTVTIKTIKTGSIFDRWRTAFAGLHSLLGFGTSMSPREEQGPATLDLALSKTDPLPLARAWFRAVREHQPNRCKDGVPYVAGMFAVDKDGKTTIDDFLPEKGTALAGPFDKDTFMAVLIPLA